MKERKKKQQNSHNLFEENEILANHDRTWNYRVVSDKWEAAKKSEPDKWYKLDDIKFSTAVAKLDKFYPNARKNKPDQPKTANNDEKNNYRLAGSSLDYKVEDNKWYVKISNGSGGWVWEKLDAPETIKRLNSAHPNATTNDASQAQAVSPATTPTIQTTSGEEKIFGGKGPNDWSYKIVNGSWYFSKTKNPPNWVKIEPNGHMNNKWIRQLNKKYLPQNKAVISGIRMENRYNNKSKSSKIINEIDYDDFENMDDLSILRDAIDKNKTVGVAFVKKNGTVRHMAIRKTLSSYEHSDKEKTEKQTNIEKNNNIKRIIDINSYIKTLKEVGDRELSAKNAWRTINLRDVLGFHVSGKFFDLRSINQIRERFGDQVYNSLTPKMVKTINDAENENNYININEVIKKKRFLNENLNEVENWDEEDEILVLYYTIYGLDSLNIDIKKMVEDVIGTNKDSFMRKVSNFKYLFGFGGLSSENKREKNVFQKYAGYDKDELKNICLNIIEKKIGGQKENEGLPLKGGSENMEDDHELLETKRKIVIKEEDLVKYIENMVMGKKKVKLLEWYKKNVKS